MWDCYSKNGKKLTPIEVMDLTARGEPILRVVSGQTWGTLAELLSIATEAERKRQLHDNQRRKDNDGSVNDNDPSTDKG